MKTTRRGFLGLFGAAVIAGPALADVRKIELNPCVATPPAGAIDTGIMVDGEPVFEIRTPVEIEVGGRCLAYQPDGGSYFVGRASRYAYTSTSRYAYTSKYVHRSGDVLAIDPRVKWKDLPSIG